MRQAFPVTKKLQTYDFFVSAPADLSVSSFRFGDVPIPFGGFLIPSKLDKVGLSWPPKVGQRWTKLVKVGQSGTKLGKVGQSFGQSWTKLVKVGQTNAKELHKVGQSRPPKVGQSW